MINARQLLLSTLFTFAGAAKIALSMNATAMVLPTIDNLFFSGYLDEWEDDFQNLESSCLLQAIDLKMYGDETKAADKFLLCARHGSTVAMYHLGLLLNAHDHERAVDWFRLAFLLHYQKTGASFASAENMLKMLKVNMALFGVAPNESDAPTQPDYVTKPTTKKFAAAMQVHDKRWQLVSVELNTWFASTKNPGDKTRALVFLILASPFHSETASISSVLQQSSSHLTQIEFCFLGEQLMNKVLKAFALLNIDVTVLKKQRDKLSIALLSALFLEESHGILGIVDSFKEFERRSLLAMTDEQRFHVANILYRSDKTPHPLTKEERTERAMRVLATVEFSEAHELLHDMYRERAIGKELSEHDRRAKMQFHIERTVDHERNQFRRALMHFDFGDYEKVHAIAGQLFTNNFAERGLLYQLLAWTLHAQIKHGSRTDKSAFLDMYAYANLAAKAGYRDSTLPVLMFFQENSDVVGDTKVSDVDGKLSAANLSNANLDQKK